MVLLTSIGRLPEEAREFLVKCGMYTFWEFVDPIMYIGRLDKQESMRIDLLPLEVNRPCQGSALVLTRPITGPRSLIRILESLSGIPR